MNGKERGEEITITIEENADRKGYFKGSRRNCIKSTNTCFYYLLLLTHHLSNDSMCIVPY